MDDNESLIVPEYILVCRDNDSRGAFVEKSIKIDAGDEGNKIYDPDTTSNPEVSVENLIITKNKEPAIEEKTIEKTKIRYSLLATCLDLAIILLILIGMFVLYLIGSPKAGEYADKAKDVIALLIGVISVLFVLGDKPNDKR